MRKGISFTLTIIIVAVLLLTAALTILTIFGSGIQGITEIFGQSEEAQIENECMDVAREIQDKICERYAVSTSSGFNVYESASKLTNNEDGVENAQTCNNQGCSIAGEASGGSLSYTIHYGSTSSPNSIDTSVTVRDRTVDCFEDDIIEKKSCPVS